MVFIIMLSLNMTQISIILCTLFPITYIEKMSTRTLFYLSLSCRKGCSCNWWYTVPLFFNTYIVLCVVFKYLNCVSRVWLFWPHLKHESRKAVYSRCQLADGKIVPFEIPNTITWSKLDPNTASAKFQNSRYITTRTPGSSPDNSKVPDDTNSARNMC